MNARENALRIIRFDRPERVADIGVYTGCRAYHYDGLEVLPAGQFLKRLHEGGIF